MGRENGPFVGALIAGFEQLTCDSFYHCVHGKGRGSRPPGDKSRSIQEAGLPARPTQKQPLLTIWHCSVVPYPLPIANYFQPLHRLNIIRLGHWPF